MKPVQAHYHHWCEALSAFSETEEFVVTSHLFSGYWETKKKKADASKHELTENGGQILDWINQINKQSIFK